MTRVSLIVGAMIIAVIAYFIFAPSHQLARAAKSCLEKKDYKCAYEISTQALKADPYNKSAFATNSQSRQRLEIAEFLKEAKQSANEAQNITQSAKITPQELLQLKWLCERFFAKSEQIFYKNSPTKDEKAQVEKYNEWFSALQMRINEARAAGAK